MTLPRRGRGRRDNGLQAPLWAPLRDVDPRVGEHLLDLLREEGIAAYLEPATDVSPYTRTVSLPSPPADRLYVDRARRTEARAVVDRHGDTAPPRLAPPGPSRRPISADPEFAAIVAAFQADQPTPQPHPTEPPEHEDHYEPPLPPPVPRLPAWRVYTLLLVVVGVVLIGAPSRLGLSSDVGLVLGVTAVVSGVTVLVSRMKDRPDDGDDGAVI